jgi:acyl carrier protein
MTLPMATTLDDYDARIRSVVAEYGRLAVDANSCGAEDDLYQVGMTSHATVNVMLGLEGEFDVEFPDDLLKPSVFASIASIREALRGIPRP